MNTTYMLNCVAGNLFRSKMAPGLPDEFYIGLSTTAPAIDGTGVTEPAEAANYARVQLSVLTEPSNGVVSNRNDIRFNETSASWGTVTHFVIYDAETVGAGNLLMYGQLTTPRSMEPATVLTIKAGDLKLSVQNPA